MPKATFTKRPAFAIGSLRTAKLVVKVGGMSRSGVTSRGLTKREAPRKESALRIAPI